MFRHKLGRLLQEHGVGLASSEGAEVREVLPVLLRTVSRHQVQHHDQTKNAFLHDQPDPAVRRHLLGDGATVLHAGQLRREDHHGHDHSYFTHHLSTAGRRDQPFYVAGDAAHRQISAIHHGAGHLLYCHDRSSAKCPPALGEYARHVAVRQRTLSQSSSSSAVHAKTAGQSVWQQIHEGDVVFTLSLL